LGEPVEILTVTEAGLLDSVRMISPATAERWSRRLDSRARATALMISVGALTLAAFYFFGLPVAANYVAERLPASWEEQLGRNAWEGAIARASRCANPTVDSALTAIVDRLIAQTPSRLQHFTVAVVDDSVVNAFAAPGGYIMVNRGLLEATDTPEELAGVLAHEIQHVVHHHVTRGMVREIPLRILAGSLAGGADAIGSALTRAAGTLGALSFRREDEAEADRDGMKMLQAARIDSRGMISFFQKLAARQSSEPRLVGYLSTHPQTSQRLEALNRLAEASKTSPEPLRFSGPWGDLKSGCNTVR
jgi:predicted Zn-dependent protease